MGADIFFPCPKKTAYHSGVELIAFVSAKLIWSTCRVSSLRYRKCCRWDSRVGADEALKHTTDTHTHNHLYTHTYSFSHTHTAPFDDDKMSIFLPK